jgi:hypothetical protein
MRRDQFEHAIRTACQIIGRPEVIVVGSQAILGTFREDELPRQATMSGEIDILPIAESNEETAQLADRIEGLPGSSRRSNSFMALVSMASTCRLPRCRRADGIDWSKCRTPTRPQLVADCSSLAGASTRKISASLSCAHFERRTRTSSPRCSGSASSIQELLQRA